VTADPGRRRAALLAVFLPPAWGGLFALSVASLLILAVGARPAEVYGLLLRGTWGTAYGVGQVLFKATPLIFTGLAVALALRAGLFNIGAEGQLTVAAFATAMVGTHAAGLPAVALVPLCLGAGFAGGALVGAIPGVLKATRGAHEVVSTIMINFVVRAAMVGFGRASFERETVHTRPIAAAAELPRLERLFPSLAGSAASAALPLAVGVALALAWLLQRTRTGFRLRALGLSKPAAETAGFAAGRLTVLALALSGGVAGLAGSSFVLGYKHYYEDGFSGGVGFVGIAVAVLGRSSPLGVLAAALVLGTLAEGALAVNAVVPKELVDVLQAIIILAVIGSAAQARRLVRR
jgi:simple sugar transport system permease protein